MTPRSISTFPRQCAKWPSLCAVCLVAVPLHGAVAQNADNGREIARSQCARCHVVDPTNRYAGISSTPSFMTMVEVLPDWRERFETFYARRPHPVHVRVNGLDAPGPDTNPPNAAPFTLKPSDVADLTAYAASLRKRP